MNSLKATALLFILIAVYACNEKQQPIDEKFNGMWRLDKYEAFDSLTNKWTDDTTRIGHSGYIMYDGKGHMSVHLTPKGYKEVDISKNIDSLDLNEARQRAKFYQSNITYFADYETTDSTITHKKHSATNPNDWGTSVVRSYQFINDTLILTPLERIGGQQLRLRWIKR